MCNYAAVDYLGLTGSNESEGVYYLDFESYSVGGTSTDGYTAMIAVNGESSPIDYNYVVDNNNAWYIGYLLCQEVYLVCNNVNNDILLLSQVAFNSFKL